MPIFTREAPARSIDELSDYLLKTAQPGHLFRGQTKSYSRNAPSAARPAVCPDGSTDRWVALDDYSDRASRREIARYDLRAVLMQFWGPGIGNLLAQQYGIASDGYDFTADLNIAAFFATKSYPYYVRYKPTDPTIPGVIYRVNVADQVDIDIETVNFTLGSLGYFEKAKNAWIYFTRPIFRRALGTYAKRHGISFVPAKVDELVPEPRIALRLLKSEVALSNESIQRLQGEILQTRRLDVASGSELVTTRASRQAGAMYFPSYIRPAIVGAEIELEPIGGGRFAAIPSYAIVESATHVQEMQSFRCLETFFFLHTDANRAGDLEPEYLWPSRKDDWMFDYICRFAEIKSARYLEDTGAAIDDLKQGLIDPGYAR